MNLMTEEVTDPSPTKCPDKADHIEGSWKTEPQRPTLCSNYPLDCRSEGERQQQLSGGSPKQSGQKTRRKESYTRRSSLSLAQTSSLWRGKKWTVLLLESSTLQEPLRRAVSRAVTKGDKGRSDAKPVVTGIKTQKKGVMTVITCT